MGQAKSLKAYPVVRELMNRALEAPNGVKVTLPWKEAFKMRMSFYSIMKRYRDAQAVATGDVFTPGPYDRLRFTLPPPPENRDELVDFTIVNNGDSMLEQLKIEII